MASVPSVSIVVPAYGVAHLIGETLRSLQGQTRPDWEAIVVDDGSPDDVEAALREFAADPRIRLIRTANGGLAAARNRGAALARSPLLALLDGDDAYCPTYVEEMLALFEGRPTLGFVTCDATYFGSADRAGSLFSSHHPQDGPVTLDRVLARRFNVFVGSVIRKEAFDSIGGFDASLRSAEDLDLWIRLLSQGYEAACLSRPLVRYRRRPGSLSTDARTMLASERRVFEKAAAALDGRVERAVAGEAIDRLAEREAHEEAERLILAGEARRGLSMLRGYHRQSVRWRIAKLLIGICPPLGKPILLVRNAISAGRRAK
jgi:cellulose synthase/poly-beta-1,6-N-acetylglucosamine synthase-like glycosyltransferase